MQEFVGSILTGATYGMALGAIAGGSVCYKGKKV